MVSSDTHHDAQDTLNIINKRTGRNMPQAIATGAVLVVLILGTLLLSPHAFAYLVIAFMVFAIWELRVDFATIGLHVPPVALWLCSIFILLSTYYSERHLMGLGASLLVSVIVVGMSAALNPFRGNRVHRAVQTKIATQNSSGQKSSGQPRGGNVEKAASTTTAVETPFVGRMADVAVSIFSLLYIPLLAGFLVLLLVQPQPHIKEMMAIFIPALGDTGGLVFGAAFGKHKLSPRISPKKSYEGLLGSIVFCIIGSVLFYGFTFQEDFLGGGWWKPVVLGVVVAITGTLGDLSASMLKRDLGIKDMGHLLKGHGGILDRVDSILISAPFVYVLFAAFGV